MRNQLWFKLTGAFALIIFIGVVVTVWLASQGTATQFEHFMVANQMVRPATMQAVLAELLHAARTLGRPRSERSTGWSSARRMAS